MKASRSIFLPLAAVLIAVVGSSQPRFAAAQQVQLRTELVAGSTALSTPVATTYAPGDPDALYVAEQNAARISRLDLVTGARTTLLDDTFALGGEKGYKGLAFHPDYATNGRFYVHYYDGTNVNILEYTKQAGESQADLATERTILSFFHPVFGESHTGGWIGFSPNDNYLYVPTGDGGACTQPECGLPAQDLTDLRGKLLRLDIDGDDFPTESDRNYSIPADNPFVNIAGEDEIFAYGLRSPWRGSFDRTTGDLYIADVGSSHREEINLLPAGSGGGQNYGWRVKEGSVDNPTFDDPPLTGETDPLYEYPRGSGAAVIGGYVYRGSEIPDLVGDYILADFVQRTITTFDPAGGTANDVVDRTLELRDQTLTSGRYQQLVSFAEDANGELYILERAGKAIHRIVEQLVGDYDLNGIVDGADYQVWKAEFGTPDPSNADGNLDGLVDAADYTVWRDNLGATLPALGQQPPVASNVPEPSCFLLALIPLTILFWRK